MNKLLIALSIAVLAAAQTTFAETYYWNKSGDNSGAYYKWSDPANWLVGDTKVAATAVPGEGDVIKRDNDQKTESMYIDLEGESISIGGILFNSGSWGGDTIYVKNGSLTFTSEASFSARGVIHLDDASMIFNGTSRFGHWNYGDDAKYQMDVTLNGTSVLEINASTYLARVGFTVNNGAVLRFGTGVKWENANAGKEVPISINGGVLDMPNGHKPNGTWSYHPHVVLTTGQWNLGNEVKYANNIRFYAELSGGVLKATNDVKFDLNTTYDVNNKAWAKFNDGANVTLDVVEGKTLDLSNFTFDGAATVTKTGTGALKLKDVPSCLKWQEGAITFAANTQTTFSELALPVNSTLTLSNKDTSISYLSAMDGMLTIAAQGLIIYTAEDASLTGTFALDASVFAVGDTILVSEDENLRAKVMADLKATGNNIIEEGTALKLGASELIFDSTTVKDLSDPNGWSCGSVPPAGASVTIKGSGVEAEVLGKLPLWSSITLMDGAKLTTKAACTFGKIALSGGATLEVAADTTLTLTDGLAFEDNLESADGMSAITVATGATLKVPGSTKFKNVALTLNGSLIGLTDGPFVFGTANADETAYFAMTATNATITALNGVGVENASRIDFAVPAVGGTVVVTAPITLTGTTFTYNKMDGFAFGLNNPSDRAFQVIADTTPINIGAETTVAGGANLVLDNSILLRKRHSEGDTSESKYNINVLNRGKITLKNGGEICAGVTRVNGNLVDGAIRVNPDEDGYVGIEVLEGGVCTWYKANGYDKGTIRFAGGSFHNVQTTWWSWGNRSHILNKFAAIDLVGETTTFITGYQDTRLSSRSEFAGFELESPFSGAGNLTFENTWSGKTMEPNIICGNNTCTGTLRVAPDNGNAKTILHFANGANWAGPVVWCERMDLVVNHDYMSDAEKIPAPTTVSFESLVCDEPTTFTFRLWGGDKFKNDTVNVTGAGWGKGFTLNFAMQGGYEAKPGDAWCLGTIPANSILPASPSEKWSVYTEKIDGDDDFVKLMAGPASLAFNFISTESGDLTDPKNWECGYVPTGKDVVIKGAGVKAVVTDAETMPVFGSIEVREGASLAFEQAEGEVTIPSLTLDATATLTIGGENLAPVVTLTGAFESHAKAENETLSLSKFVIASGATLNVPGGTKFQDINLTIEGTLATVSAGDLTLGGAPAGTTGYIGLNVDGGVVSTFAGDILICCAEVGGSITAVGDELLFSHATLARDKDHGISFGVNTPSEIELPIVFDATDIKVGFLGTHVIAGGSVVTLKNGSHFYKGDEKDDNGGRSTGPTSFFVQGNARIEVGEGCALYYGAGSEHDTWGYGAAPLAFGTAEQDVVSLTATCATFDAHHAKGNGTAVLSVADSTNLITYCTWNRSAFLNAFKEVNVTAGNLTMYLPANAVNNGDVGSLYTTFSISTPICGEGGFAFCNDSRYPASCIINSSVNNTALGRISADGDAAETKLIFDDGANWAGTVVWNDNVAITNFESGASATTVSFGAVELNGNLPIRVWVDEKGVVTSDTINITGAGFSGEGKIVLDFQGEVNPAEIDGFVPLGTLPEGAALPAVKKNAGATWKVITQQVGDKIVYGIKRSTGLMITVF